MDHQQRIEKGQKFIEWIWYRLARRIVHIAGTHYGWNNEQWEDAQRQFLRPNDYKVILR